MLRVLEGPVWSARPALAGLFLLGAFGSAGETLAADGAAGWAPEKLARLDALVAHFLRPQRTTGAPPPPSLSLAIGVDGKLVAAKGYGEGRPGSGATERTVYCIGSLAKQFTAAAVLRLIEDGAKAPISGAALTLETPMAAIFHGVDNWTAEGEPPVTVRSLLNMTSNLPNFTRRPPPNVDPWGAVPALRLLDELKKVSPKGWPHSFEYSNTSYFLLAHVIEAVTAARYRDYVRAATIAKAGMAATRFVDEDTDGLELAAPSYRRRPAFTQPDWLKGSGDMMSSALDLFLWNRALMDGRIIGWKSRAAMFADGARVAPVRYYGMGWFIDHEGRWDKFSHSGAVPGFTAFNVILKRQHSPSWVSVTLLTNADEVEGLDVLADDILDLARAD